MHCQFRIALKSNRGSSASAVFLVRERALSVFPVLRALNSGDNLFDLNVRRLSMHQEPRSFTSPIDVKTTTNFEDDRTSRSSWADRYFNFCAVPI